MRPSPLRHTLAVLRTTIGLTQKEMAELAECSTATIQAIELGKLRLSDRLVRNILPKTGISGAWLEANDVAKAPLNHENKPYTTKTFEQFQAMVYSKPANQASACHEVFDIWTMLSTTIDLLTRSYAEAYKQKCAGMFGYRTILAILEVSKKTLKGSGVYDAAAPAIRDRDVSPLRINDMYDSIRSFAEQTWEEFRRRIDESGKQLEEPVVGIAKDLDKQFHYVGRHHRRALGKRRQRRTR